MDSSSRNEEEALKKPGAPFVWHDQKLVFFFFGGITVEVKYVETMNFGEAVVGHSDRFRNESMVFDFPSFLSIYEEHTLLRSCRPTIPLKSDSSSLTLHLPCQFLL